MHKENGRIKQVLSHKEVAKKIAKSIVCPKCKLEANYTIVFGEPTVCRACGQLLDLK